MNTLDYNVSGEKRKQLVRVMSEILGEDAVYQGAPSFAYRVDGYMVSRNGLVTCPDTATREEIIQLVGTLREQGFVLENFEDNSSVFTVEMRGRGSLRQPWIISRKLSLARQSCSRERLERKRWKSSSPRTGFGSRGSLSMGWRARLTLTPN